LVLKPMDVTQLPLIATLGIEESTDSKYLLMTPADVHWNHVGTIYAGAIYSLAEVASGHRLLQAFPKLPSEGIAMLRSSNVKYTLPAKSVLRAAAEIADEQLEKLKSRLERKGRGSVDVAVSVFEDDVEVFAGTFNWFVAKNSGDPPS
jgi:thioesterase domain-containing protein